MTKFNTIKTLEGEIKTLKEDNGVLTTELEKLKLDSKYAADWTELLMERARNEIRKELTKAQITADLERVKALAKLEAYEKYNTSDDKEFLTKTIENLITAITEALKNSGATINIPLDKELE